MNEQWGDSPPDLSEEIVLVGFAYGEDLEQGSGRSLGYRLLAPPVVAVARGTGGWIDEVEALARRLQAAPYPEHWPATDLFCSIILEDGRRLVALARYGLTDHTAGLRRGGLEFIGVVGPVTLEVQTALTIYRWLQTMRASAEDLYHLGGVHALDSILSFQLENPDDQHPAFLTGQGELASPVPILPVRIWQEGAFLFAASAPADPNHHLKLLEIGTGANWQWLPLIGPDFPLALYARRGPLVAWTPHLAGVAMRMDRPPPEFIPRARRRLRFSGALTCLLVLLFMSLLAGNIWYLRELHRQLASLTPVTPPSAPSEPPRKSVRLSEEAEEARERFATALYRVLADRGGEKEWNEERTALLDRYKDMAARDKELRIRSSNEKGQVSIAALSILAGRSGDKIEETVRKGLAGKGFSEKLINLACEHIREHYAQEAKER